MSDTPTSQLFSWRDVMLRMQQASRGKRCALVSVQVWVEHGEPVQWEEPQVSSIEPSSAAQSFMRRLRAYVRGPDA